MRMLTILLCLGLFGISMGEQRQGGEKGHSLAGVVVDDEGQPLAEADIDHVGGHTQRIQTDASGRFTVEIYSPAIVIRKAGYKSVWMRAQDGNGIKVRLESLAQSGQSFPVCEGDPLSGAKRFGPLFKLPLSRELVNSNGGDVDYSEQVFRLKGVRGKNYLVHGWGPTWSFGIPIDDDVWNSVAYEERVFSLQGIPVMDARGTLSNGKRWRVLAIFGETLGYDGLDEKAAAAFDGILDRACFQLREKE